MKCNTKPTTTRSANPHNLRENSDKNVSHTLRKTPCC